MWKKEHIVDVFFYILRRIKRFLTGKDLFIFLFFLIISTAVWGLQAMRKTYETVVQIPVIYENLPAGYAQTEELPEKLKVTISDMGIVLLNYRTVKRFDPVPINVENLQKKKLEIYTKTLEPAILKQLSASTRIVNINPPFLHLKFIKLKEKAFYVKLAQHIDLAQQYTLSDPIEITPRTIKVYAPENILDTMQFVYTEPLKLTKLKDTIRQTVKVKEIKGVVYSANSVSVTVKPEKYTEKMVEAAIMVTNVPHNHILRIFPPVVNVNFQLGLSLYDKINASSFVLAVDYNEALKGSARKENKKLPVEIKKQPEKIFNVRINPQYVDYLIEERD